jgi:hypothetical protein
MPASSCDICANRPAVVILADADARERAVCSDCLSRGFFSSRRDFRVIGFAGDKGTRA